MMQISGDTVRTIGSAVTISGAIVAVTLYISKLESRISDLEGKVHTLTLAPYISGRTDIPNRTTSDTRRDMKDGTKEIYSIAEPVINPVAQACADLVREAIDSAKNNKFNSASELRALMDKVGCTKIK